MTETHKPSTEIAREALLSKFNFPPTQYPKEKCVHQIFEEMVLRFPEKIAVDFQKQTLTYRELNQRANQIAHYLKSINIKEEESVGVFVKRNIEMIVAFIAILKIGAVYLPLDPVYPTDRLQFMIMDTKTHTVLADEELKSAIVADRIISLQQDFPESSKHNLKTTIDSDALAYIMYTSGSTGNPKGIAIIHKGIVRLVKNTNYVDIKPEHTFAQISNSCFDAATFEIWGALLNGGTLVIIPTEDILIASRLKRVLMEKHVDASFITSALFNQLVSILPDTFSSLTYAIVGGEALNPIWIKEALKSPPKNLINGYGPTENTTFSICHQIKEVIDGESIPIGKPISNTQAFILDENLNPTEIGSVGELYLGGDGLAREYVNRPEITEKSFIKNPFGEGRLYKTGDLVRYKETGDIEFIGRVDHQVKIRGFRIELGEIENKLFTIPQVGKAVVLVKQNTMGDKILVAYVEHKPDQTITPEQLKKYLQENLPYYMIPSHFVIMDTFPINQNGKIDRKALPELQQKQNDSSYIAYSDATEGQLLYIWKEILANNEITMKDNFFELGGNSLLATQLLFQINKKFACDVPLEYIYKCSNLEELAEKIKKIESSHNNQNIILLKSGKTVPLFILPDLAGDTASFSHIIKNLAQDQLVYGFRPPGVYDEEKQLKSIKEMATFYLSCIKQIQKEGPYMLAGLSMAGSIAYEIAQQLTNNNEKVALLVLLDTDSGLSFHIKNVKTTLKIIVSLWHNIWYQVVRPKKMNKSILQELIMAVELIWHVKLSIDDFLICKTEEEQYEHLLAELKKARRFPPYVTLDQFKKISNLVSNNYLAALFYFPRKYKGILHFFKPLEKSEHFTLVDHKKWKRLCQGGLKTYEFPGNHFNFFLDPTAKEVAKQLQECINQIKDKQ